MGKQPPASSIYSKTKSNENRGQTPVLAVQAENSPPFQASPPIFFVFYFQSLETKNAGVCPRFFRFSCCYGFLRRTERLHPIFWWSITSKPMPSVNLTIDSKLFFETCPLGSEINSFPLPPPRRALKTCSEKGS